MVDALAPPFAPGVPLPFTPSLAPASAHYLRGEDNLRLTSFNSLTAVELALDGLLLDPAGRIVSFSQRQVPNTDRTSASTVFRAGEGWLLSLQVRASAAAPRVGQCFVIVEVVRGLLGGVTPLTTLLQGYVTDTSRRAWPASPIRSSAEGPGVIRAIVGTDPGAGVESTETVPTNARWRLLAHAITLVTAVAAANREVSLVLDDGTNVFLKSVSGFTQTASLTHNYFAFHHGSRNTVAQDLSHTYPIPRVELMGGYRIRTFTTNLQAADNLGAPTLLVEEWIED
jgi:hypothetical protein